MVESVWSLRFAWIAWILTLREFRGCWILAGKRKGKLSLVPHHLPQWPVQLLRLRQLLPLVGLLHLRKRPGPLLIWKYKKTLWSFEVSSIVVTKWLWWRVNDRPPLLREGSSPVSIWSSLSAAPWPCRFRDAGPDPSSTDFTSKHRQEVSTDICSMVQTDSNYVKTFQWFFTSLWILVSLEELWIFTESGQEGQGIPKDPSLSASASRASLAFVFWRTRSADAFKQESYWDWTILNCSAALNSPKLKGWARSWCAYPWLCSLKPFLQQ